jgi:hypothetical protein
MATVRYLLRATGPHTPFGLLAGVAPASVGQAAVPRWGTSHRTVVRVDTQWLAYVIERWEACPELLEHIDVVFTNLAIHRGGRLEAPHGPSRITARYTSAVQAARNASSSPIQFAALAAKLTEFFPAASRQKIDQMLTDLVQQGFLITCLYAPVTITDPLAHLLDQLSSAKADTVPPVASILDDQEFIQAGIHRHNHEDPVGAEQSH